MKKIIVGLVLASVVAGQAQAFDWFGGRLSIGGGYGRAKPKLPYGYQDSDEDGQMWTAHVKYFVNDLVSVVASYADLQPHNRTTGIPIRFRPIIGSVRLNIFHHLPFTPYLTAGAGVSMNKREFFNSPATSWTKPAMQGGLGMEFFINQGTSLGAEALYHNFIGDNHNIPYRLVSLVGTINVYFGEGPVTAKARADAEQSRQQAELLASQKAALEQEAAEAKSKASAESAGKAEAEKKMKEAQDAIDQIKAMVARKDLSPVMFETGSAELLLESHEVLDKVAATAKKYPDLKLRVEGHTDSQGKDAYNQKLSQQRADSVRSYLVHHDGLPPDQVVAVGFGESRPIASNDTTEGRAQNRRVEFIFFLK